MNKDETAPTHLGASDTFTWSHFFKVLGLYWRQGESSFAWLSVVALFVLSLLAVATALVINEWYKHFYNAIQELNADRFYFLILVFLAIISFSVIRSVLIAYLVDVLALRWRRWMTNYYLSEWVLRSGHPGRISQQVDNPDQRIAEDINKFTFETIDLACGLIYTIGSVVSFSIVLISISGDAEVFGITVHDYMFWAALAYATLGTYVSQRLGVKLIGLSNRQQRCEADFRYFLVRFREGSPTPAHCVRRRKNHSSISEKLDISLSNLRNTIKVKARLSLFTETYSQFSLMVSSLLSVPRFFSGSIMLGDVMQINSAFGNLCENLSWFIRAYHRLADWKATTDRLLSFDRILIQQQQQDVVACTHIWICPSKEASELQPADCNRACAAEL